MTEEMKKPPSLENVDTANVVKFLQQYDAYVENVTSVNIGRNRANQIEIIRMISCCKRKVVFSLEDEIGLEENMSVVEKDERIVTYLRNVANRGSEDDRRVKFQMHLRSIRMNMELVDNVARVLDLFGNLRESMQEAGLDYANFRDDETKFGGIVVDMIEAHCFRPKELEYAVSRRLKNSAGKMTKSDLEKLLKETSSLLQTSYILKKGVEKLEEGSSTAKKHGFQKQSLKIERDTSRKSVQSFGKKIDPSSSKYACLKCQSLSHRIYKCPQVKDKNEAKEIIQKFFASKGKSPNKRKVYSSYHESDETEAEAKLRKISMDPVVNGIANLFNGKEDNLLSGEDTGLSNDHFEQKEGHMNRTKDLFRKEIAQNMDKDHIPNDSSVEGVEKDVTERDIAGGVSDDTCKISEQKGEWKQNALHIQSKNLRSECSDAGKKTAFQNEFDSDQTIDIRFNKKIVLRCLMDSGSTHSIMPKKVLEKIGLDESQIAPPLKNSYVTLGDGLTKVQCTGVATCNLELEIYVQTSWKNVRFLIVDIDEDQPIIGENELRSLGIDPKSALLRIIRRSQDDSSQDVPEVADEVEDETYQQIVEVGKTSDEELQKEINNMIQRAKDQGLPKELWPELEQMVTEYKDVFRVKLRPEDGPALVTPMDVHLVKDAKQVRQSNRRYTEEEMEAMLPLLKDLQEGKCIYRNPHAKWASPVMMVAKPKQKGLKNEYRMVCDLKVPNKQIHQTHWPMPHFETILRKLRKSKYFALLDAFKGYWQFPVTPKCGELYSLKTPYGVFTPTRIVQGSTDAVKYFQAGMEEALLSEEFQDFLLWVDDILSHAETPAELLKALRRILQRCKEMNIKLSAKKCMLFMTAVIWCGRMISEKGVSFDPEYLQGLKDMHPPVTMADLQQWVCSMNWIRSTIPNFAEEMSTMQTAYRNCVQKVGSAKSHVLKRRKLENFQEIWGEKEKKSFQSTKELMSSSITLSHVDPQKILCIFPDASKYHWGLLITQIPQEDKDLEFEKQRHEPLLCQSGSFNGSSLRWHIREKEAYPIVNAMMKLRYMLKRSDGFKLFTDHRNLVFVFDKEDRLNAGHTFKHADDRLSRWSLLFMGYRYTVEHIPGEQNVVADLLSRWGANNRMIKCRAITAHPGLVQPLEHPDFIWPTLAEIASHHTRMDPKDVPKGFKLENCKDAEGKRIRLFKNRKGQIFVLDKGLRDRICIIAHAGSAGHRKIDVTMDVIRKKFFWIKLRQYVESFCKSCLHCQVDGPSIIPRPLGEAVHGRRPNEVLHYDFMYIGKSRSFDGRIFTYILVLKDDFSHYVDLVPCTAADSLQVVNALMEWHGRYGIPEIYVSDQGSHFKNEVVAELNRLTHTNHHFTHAYTPQSNGTVERVNRELRRLLRVWNSEFRIRLDQWPNLLPLMRQTLNFTARPENNISPAQAFGGFSSRTNLDTLFIQQTKEFRQPMVNSDEFKKTCLDLTRYLDGIHKRILNTRRGRSKRNERSVHANFDLGSFVMVASNSKGRSLRSKPMWTGPYRVVRVVSQWSYDVQHLVTEKVINVHSSRLSFYCDKYLNVTAELKEQILFDESNGPEYYEVENIIDHRWEDSLVLRVAWSGYELSEATWIPIQQIYEDAPQVVLEYVRAVPQQRERQKMMQVIGQIG